MAKIKAATNVTYSYEGGIVSLRFDGVPSQTIREAMKQRDYLWRPSLGIWTVAARNWSEFVAWIGLQLPGGAAPEGDIAAVEDCSRNEPVIDVDAMYEDQCRAACGL